MSELTRVAIDTSKSVFTLHGVDAAGRAVLRRNFRRHQFEAFFERQPAVEVVLEACGGSHHWGRWLARLGHRVRLIPPQYVKPFVKRGKNDRNDAEAICVAAAQPSIGRCRSNRPSSRPRRCCCRRASCWCASAPNWSTRCAAMPPSSAWWPPSATRA